MLHKKTDRKQHETPQNDGDLSQFLGALAWHCRPYQQLEQIRPNKSAEKEDPVMPVVENPDDNHATNESDACKSNTCKIATEYELGELIDGTSSNDAGVDGE